MGLGGVFLWGRDVCVCVCGGGVYLLRTGFTTLLFFNTLLLGGTLTTELSPESGTLTTELSPELGTLTRAIP